VSSHGTGRRHAGRAHTSGSGTRQDARGMADAAPVGRPGRSGGVPGRLVAADQCPVRWPAGRAYVPGSSRIHGIQPRVRILRCPVGRSTMSACPKPAAGCSSGLQSSACRASEVLMPSVPRMSCRDQCSTPTAETPAVMVRARGLARSSSALPNQSRPAPVDHVEQARVGGVAPHDGRAKVGTRTQRDRRLPRRRP
jgi:hypothetical protein